MKKGWLYPERAGVHRDGGVYRCEKFNVGEWYLTIPLTGERLAKPSLTRWGGKRDFLPRCLLLIGPGWIDKKRERKCP